MAGGIGSTAHARPRNASGFTIIELLATIAIVAILAAVSLPRFSTNAPFAARGYADELASSLRHARNVAIASSCAVQFTVNAGGYQALQQPAVANSCNPAGAFVNVIRRGDGSNLAGWPPANANVAAGRVVVFSANGTVTGAVPAAIVVGPFSITVDAGGWVQVQ